MYICLQCNVPRITFIKYAENWKIGKPNKLKFLEAIKLKGLTRIVTYAWGKRTLCTIQYLQCQNVITYNVKSNLWCEVKTSVIAHNCLHGVQLFVGGNLSCLCCLCLLGYSGVQQMLCFVFCFVYICLLCPVLPCFRDCPFWFALRCSLTFIYMRRLVSSSDKVTY